MHVYVKICNNVAITNEKASINILKFIVIKLIMKLEGNYSVNNLPFDAYLNCSGSSPITY